MWTIQNYPKRNRANYFSENVLGVDSVKLQTPYECKIMHSVHSLVKFNSSLPRVIHADNVR